MNTRITYTATTATMGDAITDAEADRYVSMLADKLALAFPGADVAVERDDCLSNSLVDVDDDIDPNDVREIANQVWNSGDWF